MGMKIIKLKGKPHLQLYLIQSCSLVLIEWMMILLEGVKGEGGDGGGGVLGDDLTEEERETVSHKLFDSLQILHSYHL
jgi:hypothetical protein